VGIKGILSPFFYPRNCVEASIHGFRRVGKQRQPHTPAPQFCYFFDRVEDEICKDILKKPWASISGAVYESRQKKNSG